MTFKEKAFGFPEEEYIRYYKELSDCHIKRNTDLNKACINEIIRTIVGTKILDIACGTGYLTLLIAQNKKLQVTGIDIHIPEKEKNNDNITFLRGNVEHIEFPDQFFDTVICAHTLEHVQNLEIAIQELRRVTAKRLIIIVPRQREYKYTFDLHLHFFPYAHSLMKIMKNQKAFLEIIDNDLFYLEDRSL